MKLSLYQIKKKRDAISAAFERIRAEETKKGDKFCTYLKINEMICKNNNKGIKRRKKR